MSADELLGSFRLIVGLEKTTRKTVVPSKRSPMRLKSVALLVVTLILLIYAVNRQSGAALRGNALSANALETEGTPEVTWAMLRGMDAKTGKATPEVQAIDGKPVRVPGYIVPLDDDARELTEFLLVPYNGACVHTPPPPPNQMVYVKMTRGERASFKLMDAVWVNGAIFLGRRSSPYGPAFYAMTATRVDPY